MDDVSRASNDTTFDRARPAKAERSKRGGGGGRKAKKWFCKIVPSIEGCAKPPDADPPMSFLDGPGPSRKQQQKKKRSPRGDGCSCCCPSSCLCGRKAGERTSKKQIPVAEICLRDAGAVVDELPTRKTTDVVNVVVNEVVTARRSKPADHVFEALSLRKPVEESTNLAERLPPPSKGHVSGATVVLPERLPPGPARDLPVPNPIVGQEVCLKTALSYLTDDAVGIMGIYGTGGVGKTTLLRSINNKFYGHAARTEFDHVILVAVGKDPDVKKIQRDIAYEVGLLLMDDESEVKRAAAIFDFLKTKNFLLLLDNLWGPLELARIGIPHPSSDGHKQKVIVSSRSMDVPAKMQAHKILRLDCLKWEEAWKLFSSKVGEENLADRRIRSIAVALAKECGGLPLALVAMGSAMSAKKTPEEWQKAVSLLKNAPLHEISGYQMLKENLIRSWMGLGSITDFDDINEAYNIGYSVIESLKAVSLMENSEKSYRRIEMHDVIREMALWTASGKESNENKWLVGAKTGETRSDEWSKAERISLMFNEIEALPDSCYCPNLQSLILRGNKHLMKIPNGLFPCMVLLRFLDLSHTGIVELPNEVGTLINLQFLNLSYTKIACLPKEMKELTTLKYLELEGTRELRKIPDGVISSLEMLQELNLYMSVCSHDSITFEELVSLQRLRSVGFTVRNIQCLLRLFSILRVSTHSLAIRELQGLISLHLLPSLLSKNKMGRLKNLTIESSQGLKELVMGEEAKTLNWQLYQLEVFNLVCLPELERVIWRGVAAHVCLPNLRFLSLFYCTSLKNIAWVAHLPLLQELYIQNCNEMERVIADEPPTASSEKEEKPTTTFPNLKYIFLRDLKRLVKIDDQVLEFPCLERILVYNCIGLKQLPLGATSAQKLMIIFGERNWWESLEWGDQSIKSIFTTCFREIPAGYEPSMKILEGL
ncbi:disease resistance protein RPS2-like [Curcuma longa]|uniref:disease resistance protein RPS2-like n=1 Tax=Curcuma longa TaxID=136217 RepID=UPI003D9DFC3D